MSGVTGLEEAAVVAGLLEAWGWAAEAMVAAAWVAAALVAAALVAAALMAPLPCRQPMVVVAAAAAPAAVTVEPLLTSAVASTKEPSSTMLPVSG